MSDESMDRAEILLGLGDAATQLACCEHPPIDAIRQILDDCSRARIGTSVASRRLERYLAKSQ